jgi:hypothetical protein
LTSGTRRSSIRTSRATSQPLRELHEVLEAVVGRFQGTFVSCIPGRLAYFEGERENDRYILERPA